MSEISGFVAAGFEPVREAFQQNFDEGLELGAGFAAYLGDELVADLRGGFADRAQTIAWSERTIAPVYSTTKPVAALVIAMLVERGQLEYDSPVANYWPEFAAEGKGAITVAEAMSHQAGLPGFTDPIDAALWTDPPKIAEALAKLKPMWGRGEGSGYHPLTWGYIVGELVRRVSRRSLGTILREDVCGPLGIDFWIGLPETRARPCCSGAEAKGADRVRREERGAKGSFPNALGRRKPRRGGMAARGNTIRQRPWHGERSGAALFGLCVEGADRGDAGDRAGNLGGTHADTGVGQGSHPAGACLARGWDHAQCGWALRAEPQHALAFGLGRLRSVRRSGRGALGRLCDEQAGHASHCGRSPHSDY
jgi:CubicO group peptidase (beta-lactamase class C family)